MRRWACSIAALVLAVGVVSCGDDGDGETNPTTSSARRATPPSTEELTAMLLTADDIERATGDTARWEIAPTNEEGLVPVVSGSKGPCQDVGVDLALTKRLTADVGLDANRTGGSGALASELLITGDPEQLDADLDAYRHVLEPCLSTSATPSETPATYEAFALPELGDQRWAFVGSPCPGWSSSSQGYSAYVRVGTVAVNLNACAEPEPATTDLPMTAEEFVQLLDTAVAKVDG